MMQRIFFILLIVLAGINTKAASSSIIHSSEKIIAITVNEKGQAFIGRDTLSLEELSPEVQKRLWKSYMGTGKMYDAIHLQFTGEVASGIKKSALDAIQLAQKNALTEICLEKYKKVFDKLSSRQQKRIEKQFPVLFISNYE